MAELKFHPEHAWVAVEGTLGTIGISDYAQKQMGEIIYVDLPEVEAEFRIGEPLCSLESNKVASDVLSPVSGTVLEVNNLLEDEPSRINASPYGEGWIVKVRLSDASEVEGLMDPKAYEAYVEAK